jgi:hypothetical protein
MNAIKIINALENLNTKNEEKQIELIVEMMKNVPAEDREDVMERCATYCTLSNANKEESWGEDAYARETEADARFVDLSQADWWKAKEEAKRHKWFRSYAGWEDWRKRIDARRTDKAMCSRIVVREMDFIGKLLAERRDIMSYPAVYGSQQQYDEQIEQIERLIRTMPAGKWRLEMEYQKERPALQVRINEIIAQVKATQQAKEEMAVARIQNMWRARMCVPEEENYVGGDILPRPVHVVRRTHDDGWAEDYDGDDEFDEQMREISEAYGAMSACLCEGHYETASPQTEKECGHMVYDAACTCGEFALGRSVFEHNSVPTSDSNIRVSYNVSHVLPESWRETVERMNK